jgi:hypothetical protein
MGVDNSHSWQGQDPMMLEVNARAHLPDEQPIPASPVYVTEGLEKRSEGVNESQLKFLTEIWPMTQN